MTPPNETKNAEIARCIPKLLGADAELGNLILGLAGVNGTGRDASHALLAEIDGLPDRTATHNPVSTAFYGGAGFAGTPAALPYVPPYAPSYTAYGTTNNQAYNPQDIGRKFLDSNGGCIYIDLDHLEVCTPEVLSAHDFVSAWHAMLRITRDALTAANAKRPAGQRVMVLVNSSDGRGNAYGSHLNFLVTRRLWDDLFIRRLHPDLFVLIAHQVSSIVYTGQGKVGAENGRTDVPYQISQRADFFDQLVGLQTTYNRPIVNSRDEPLCGAAYNQGSAHNQYTVHNQGVNTGTDDAGFARLHCIFYDSTLCHGSTLLKTGVMQIVLSMLEAGRLDASLMLEDPLSALVAFSHDPDLTVRARLSDGRELTAVELQSLFCERARAYVDSGACDGLIPGAAAIIELWEDTLDKLAQRDFDKLAPRLDWVLKRTQIERALSSRGLDWSGPEAKHLDHLYSSLDHDDGVYWALEKAGLTEALIDDARIEHFRNTPPEDTRAWTRAMLLRQVPRNRIRAVGWDRIELTPKLPGAAASILDLPDPLRHTRADWRNAIAATTDQTTPADAENQYFN